MVWFISVRFAVYKCQISCCSKWRPCLLIEHYLNYITKDIILILRKSNLEIMFTLIVRSQKKKVTKLSLRWYLFNTLLYLIGPLYHIIGTILVP